MPGSNSGIQSFSTENSSESDEQHLLGATQQKNAGRGGKQWSKQASTLLDRLAPQSRGFQSVQSHDMQISDVNDTNYIPQRWCPEEEAGWLSRLFFAFANSLVSKGAKKHLEQQDLWDTAFQDDPARLWVNFEHHMQQTATPAAPQGVMWRALCRVHGHVFLLTAVIKVLHDLVMFAQPYILEQLLHHLSGASDRWFALGLALLMLVAALVEALTINVYFNYLFRMSLHTKTELLEMLYRKSLRVSGAVKSAMGVGPIVNLQSNDAAKLWQMPTYLHMVWNGPFQIICVMAMLVRVLTLWPALAGLAVTVAIIPLTMLLGRLLTAARKDSMAAADARVKLVTEVITGIKAIKLYAWEEPYLTRITQLRETELQAIKRTQMLAMINNSIFNTGPVLVSLAAFGTYAALGHPLTAAVAFPSLALFNLLRFPIVMIPQQIMNLIAASVGIGRIQGFINSEEMAGVKRLAAAAATAASSGPQQQQQQHYNVHASSATAASALVGSTLESPFAGPEAASSAAGYAATELSSTQRIASSILKSKGSKGVTWADGRTGNDEDDDVNSFVSDSSPSSPASWAVRISEGSFAWSPETEPVLHGIDLQVVPGSLVMVVGPVGSGKSSLLAAILGELATVASSETSAVAAAAAAAAGGSRALKRRRPQVAVAGSIAYTAQDPWIQNATLKNNILMGAALDEARYQAAIAACCLETDLQTLPAGDSSEIGEKGINLSGGQKHRVALARAVYAAADVYLLDDPLSAVDAHVGRHLFEQCICGHLAGTTRLLVTHQLQYAPHADVVVVMLEGRIAHIGSFHDLVAAGVDLKAFIPLVDPTDSQQQPQIPATLTAEPASRQKQHQQAGHEFAAPLLEDAASSGDAEGGSIDSRGNSVVVQELPSFLNPAMVSGGSFASHKPSKVSIAADEAVARVTAGYGGSAQRTNVPEWGTPQTPAAAAAAAADEGSQLHGSTCSAEAHQRQAVLHHHRQQQQQHSDTTDAEDEQQVSLLNGQPHQQQQQSTYSDQHHDSDGVSHTDTAMQDQDSTRRQKGQLVLQEQRAKGQVKRSVYLAYLGSWGPLLLLPVAVMLGALVERGLQVLQNLVLSFWSNHTNAVKQASAGQESLATHDTRFYLSLYFILGLSSVGVVLGRSAVLVMGSITASRKLHKQLLAKIVRLPMSFFDAQPTGRLINRFTKDTESLDTQMAASVNSALTCLASALLSIVVVVVVSPYTVLALVPLSLLYYRVQALYIATSRELKRLDALAFSPIFQHYGESLAGLATIRAFGRQQLFADTNRAHIEQSNRAWWPIQLLNRWLSMRLELTGAVVVFVAAVGVAVIAPKNAGLAGLALTSALNLTGTLAWMVRQTTELEVNMNSVERMVEYAGEREEAAAIVYPRPPASWPQAGTIQAVQLVVKYRPELPPVLKGISFSIGACEKVGICGRTGCGKSTLMMVLFRIIEPSGGAVLIDGLDSVTLGLTDLRSRLSLVPQDPVIFSGTVRSNLDPFDQAGSDAAIWAALRQAGIDGVVKAMGAGLDSSIQEGGNNLSSGQRQLLCMARALLRSSKILVLDEATSNVDHASDSLIQQTIRTAFSHCTVLTIAHRLHTIADADKVMVLDHGRLLEFEAPRQLMQMPAGAFRGMMEEASR